jgi:hypothetical protein
MGNGEWGMAESPDRRMMKVGDAGISTVFEASEILLDHSLFPIPHSRLQANCLRNRTSFSKNARRSVTP